MGMTISSLFNRLFGKKNMRILMGMLAILCNVHIVPDDLMATSTDHMFLYSKKLMVLSVCA